MRRSASAPLPGREKGQLIDAHRRINRRRTAREELRWEYGTVGRHCRSGSRINKSIVQYLVIYICIYIFFVSVHFSSLTVFLCVINVGIITTNYIIYMDTFISIIVNIIRLNDRVSLSKLCPIARSSTVFFGFFFFSHTLLVSLEGCQHFLNDFASILRFYIYNSFFILSRRETRRGAITLFRPPHCVLFLHI